MTTTETAPDQTLATLLRIADALERIAPPRRKAADLKAADAFVWQAAGSELVPVPKVNRVALSLLRGVDRVLRVAWTLADLAGLALPGPDQVGQALLLRTRGQVGG